MGDDEHSRGCTDSFLHSFIHLAAFRRRIHAPATLLLLTWSCDETKNSTWNEGYTTNNERLLEFWKREILCSWLPMGFHCRLEYPSGTGLLLLMHHNFLSYSALFVFIPFTKTWIDAGGLSVSNRYNHKKCWQCVLARRYFFRGESSGTEGAMVAQHCRGMSR